MGTRIKAARKEMGLTQQELAEQLNVSFQAVSLWENDQTEPDLDHLKDLSLILNVSLDFLSDLKDQPFVATERLFNEEHMYTFIKTKAMSLKLENTLKALPFAKKAHLGQVRKGKEGIPYIHHPLILASHILALGLEDDVLVATALLHDVVEDCDVLKEELPVSKEIQDLVQVLSHRDENGKTEKELKDAYYGDIAKNKKAALIKCLDRINNLSGLPFGLKADKQIRMINETEEYILPLTLILKEDPTYNNAAWLIRYQMKSLLEVLKKTFD